MLIIVDANPASGCIIGAEYTANPIYFGNNINRRISLTGCRFTKADVISFLNISDLGEACA
jgi:hypothetical protein